jgi:hypothetical protein
MLKYRVIPFLINKKGRDLTETEVNKSVIFERKYKGGEREKPIMRTIIPRMTVVAPRGRAYVESSVGVGTGMLALAEMVNSWTSAWISCIRIYFLENEEVGAHRRL